MARIAGVNIPTGKRVMIALTYIHGIGPTQSKKIVASAGLTEDRRVNDLTEDEVASLEAPYVPKQPVGVETTVPRNWSLSVAGG